MDGSRQAEPEALPRVRAALGEKLCVWANVCVDVSIASPTFKAASPCVTMGSRVLPEALGLLTNKTQHHSTVQ